MKKTALACLLGTAFLGATAAHADTVSGTATFADSSNTNNLYVTGTIGSAGSFSYAGVTPGGSSVVDSDFLYLQTYVVGSTSQDRTDNVSVTFNIIDPATGTGTLNGGVSEDQVQIFGILDDHTGSVTWQNPLAITLANGETLDISLANGTFSTTGPITGCGALVDNCGYDAATFTLNAAPTPEPGSLALLGTSILGGAGVLRRRFRA